MYTLRIAAAVLVAATTVVAVGAAPSSATPSGTGLGSTAISAKGRWLVEADGRVVVMHGLNQVFKVPPYTPDADGFGDDDAAFLQTNGFDAMRVGLIWAAVEPTPGHYDDAYLASIAGTVQTLASHGIVSVLDFHQDLYNEKFQGEGAPAWAVQDGGLPNPPLGFPYNYLGNPAEWHTWDQFWKNAPAPDGVGLQTHYANMWRHVAAYFNNNAAVAGYEIMNEPFAGTLWEQCAVLFVGCPLFENGKLDPFYVRVADAIRLADTSHTVWFEPQVLFTQVDATSVGPINDPHSVLAFHDYCSTEAVTGNNTLCPPQDDLTVATAVRRANALGVPAVMTEFGATNDLPNISDMVTRNDKQRIGWLEWAYTGNDKTSASPNGQALVLDPSQSPSGANVLTAKLKTLAEPYPQVVAGNPTAWQFANGQFTLSYSTTRVGTLTRFAAGSETDIAVPAIQYPGGYVVSVTGGHVISAPNAPLLRVVSNAGAATVKVLVTAA